MLLDHDADNCGSGATQDVMTAIEAVMRAGLEDVIDRGATIVPKRWRWPGTLSPPL